MMAATNKAKKPLSVAEEECAWETGKLGRSENHVVVASDEDEAALDQAVSLKPISIRLHKSLINDLKLIAQHHGIGYQPLMRDALNRFARFELRTIAEEMHKVEQARAQLERARDKKRA